MISSLDHFIAQIRAAQIRGLPITAEDVLLGLERAIAEKREQGPVRFDLGAEHAEERARRFVERLGYEERQYELFKREQAEEDRRFGQPHFGHPDAP